MKICYPLVHSGNGGSEKYTIYLAREAIADGHKVTFVLNEEGLLIKEVQKLDAGYRIIPMRSSFNPYKVIKSVVSLKKYFNENKVEIVHTQMLREHSLAIGAKIFGAKIKIVRTFHRLDQFDWKMKPIIWLYNLKTDAFIAVSDHLKEQMATNGIKKAKITVVYNGTPKIVVEKHEKAIGFLGRVVAEKGIYELSKSYDGETPLIIAGTGPDLSKIKDLNKRNIQLLGNISDLHNFFSKISILILPSVTESTLPLVVIEALSCGVPAVTFDLPAINSAHLNDAVMLVEKGNFKEIAKTALKILENTEKLEKLPQEAHELYANHYTINRMWQETKTLYLKLLA